MLRAKNPGGLPPWLCLWGADERPCRGRHGLNSPPCHFCFCFFEPNSSCGLSIGASPRGECTCAAPYRGAASVGRCRFIANANVLKPSTNGTVAFAFCNLHWRSTLQLSPFIQTWPGSDPFVYHGLADRPMRKKTHPPTRKPASRKERQLLLRRAARSIQTPSVARVGGALGRLRKRSV